ncbi:hypothetical protein [Nonomuraea sp. 10N515B]|uniref:hypothetical protein n=1 Tax=Nonomuraea sp. 10N515B TaxID=3457422 RepID=UPI003FCD362A
MASIETRKGAKATTYRVTWMTGGKRGGARDSETCDTYTIARRFKALVEAAGEQRPAPALVADRHAVKAYEEAVRAEVRAVAGARTHDVTWREIAEAVDMAEPNAFIKYSQLLEEKRTVTVRGEPPRE